jgi:hypothetical protein
MGIVDWWMDNYEKTEVLGESATLFTVNPTWTYLVFNVVPHGERPTTNFLSHCVAYSA